MSQPRPYRFPQRAVELPLEPLGTGPLLPDDPHLGHHVLDCIECWNRSVNATVAIDFWKLNRNGGV